MNTADRITELETRIAFQEDTLDKLNNVVAQQELDLERLTRMVQLFNQQLKEALQDGQDTDSNEPPPHY